MLHPHHSKRVRFPVHWLLPGFILFVFLIGGGSRQDILSLVVLRPAACLVFLGALAVTPGEVFLKHRFILGFAAALTLSVLLQLIPLPPGIWASLPGREILQRVDQVSGVGDVWRPIAMVPPSGWNALFSLSVPLAALMLALNADAVKHRRLAMVLLAIGSLSIFVGMLQLFGSRTGPFYFYRVTNPGELVGLFSNRNHHAIFLACLFPILGYFAGENVGDIHRLRLRLLLLAAFSGLLVTTLILVGSRTGLALGLLGALSMLPLLRQPQIMRRTHRDKTIPRAFPIRRVQAAAASAIVATAALFVIYSDSAVVQRLFASGGVDELRLRAFGTIVAMAWEYFPVGSGYGSFPEVYQIHEPVELLGNAYLNHAHNDWLEVLQTGGVLGLVSLIAAVAAWARASWKVFFRVREYSTTVWLGRSASMVILLLALASLADYPLRTPSLACLFAISAVWLARAYRRGSGEDSNEFA